ncbi:MAG: VOC family protein, partial [Alphaproteobacteria bacterium]
LAPPFIEASAFNVTDLPGMQKWYETVFGFVKVRDVSATEIVMSLNPSNPNATTLVLQRSATKMPGNTNYGRLILNVKNAKDTADFLQTHGVTTRAVLPNQAYFLADPEGNQIEIYQPDYVQPARGGATPARGG